MTSIDNLVKSETYKRNSSLLLVREVRKILNRHFAEPFKTALFRATTKTKVLSGAHLGRPFLSSICHRFLDGNDIHFGNFHDTNLIDILLFQNRIPAIVDPQII